MGSKGMGEDRAKSMKRMADSVDESIMLLPL